MSVLSLNVGGLTPHGYDELCTWLHTPDVQNHVDIICLQETWRLGSAYLLPGWSWVSSLTPPASGQGVAVLVNHRFAQAPTVRFREIQVGRLLHVVIPLSRCSGSRCLDMVCTYVPFKISESATVYEKREKTWALIDNTLGSLPRRNLLCLAGGFNVDLLQAVPHAGATFSPKQSARQPARDQPRFQQMLTHHQLCALTTWSSAATYFDAQGHSSRVDFILMRMQQAKGRHVYTYPHVRLASWRSTVGHVPVGGYLQLDIWEHAPASVRGPIISIRQSGTAKSMQSGS